MALSVRVTRGSTKLETGLPSRVTIANKKTIVEKSFWSPIIPLKNRYRYVIFNRFLTFN